ncbi:ABC transporter ATP-binding protein/permease [Alcaligenaceae bacterium LF4-65]|uniref:ABC transporter ATP-binding protein/permease n=1 Tax=Zwartia hollandica TaxID=324606 RepID=A0A953T440_9BURK|nr:ABC transporter ATP-binding protein [Zwartia hollandica]MBZ1350091.1 ABC transporter ATP-binding protein/permease [Zwartia hollandica]
MSIVSGVLEPFKRLYEILPVTSKRGLTLVVILSLVASLFETASVASILPFMAIVMDPSILTEYRWAEELLASLGLHTQQAAIIAAGVLTVLVLGIGNVVTAANLWLQTRYLASARRDLATELFTGYLYLPYSFHIQRDTSSLGRVLGGDVESAIGGFLASLLSVISKGLSGIVLITLIVVVDPLVALGTVLVLGCGYMLVYRLIRIKQVTLGAKMVQASTTVGRTALEGLSGIKELRVLGRENASTVEYNKSMTELMATQASNSLASAMPRYVIEVFAYAGIVAVTLAFVLKGEGTAAIPSLALYALAGNRLVPIFQQLFAAAITIKYHTRAVESLEADLAIVRNRQTDTDENQIGALAFKTQIQLTGLSFKYPSADRLALNNITLTIPQNQSIGLVGKTGSGKTTLADVLLGLYSPASGEIKIDGVPLNSQNERAWRKRVGYVPQTVFLTNASIEKNIALGMAEEQIDIEAVKRAARMAQAEEFINQLPDGYGTIVGERGVKLSGGQRQRLGIARALYHNPDVLVFDEATSALDGMTEDAVMQAVQDLSQERTMILIAHRLRTVQACDRIVMLDSGVIVADGTYEELVSTSEPFQRLAGNGLREVQ